MGKKLGNVNLGPISFERRSLAGKNRCWWLTPLSPLPPFNPFQNPTLKLRSLGGSWSLGGKKSVPPPLAPVSVRMEWGAFNLQKYTCDLERPPECERG